jgi:hypothetical protein
MRRWRLWLWGAPAALLLAPLIAMAFIDEVAWTWRDFLFAGLLLYGAAGLFELAVRLTERPWLRTAIAAALAATVLLVWAQGAVGIF